MTQTDGKFHNMKRLLAILTGLGVFVISAYNSKNGFVGDATGDRPLAMMGWAFALAATAAEFMLTSDFKKLNWSLIFLGLCAYTYSIWTNIIGLQAWRGSAMQYDAVNIIGGIFMDVYPEAAIAWALGESRLGDVIGNLIKTTVRGDELTDTGPRKSQPQQTARTNNQPPQRQQYYPNQSLPKQHRPQEPEFPPFHDGRDR